MQWVLRFYIKDNMGIASFLLWKTMFHTNTLTQRNNLQLLTFQTIIITIIKIIVILQMLIKAQKLNNLLNRIIFIQIMLLKWIDVISMNKISFPRIIKYLKILNFKNFKWRKNMKSKILSRMIMKLIKKIFNAWIKIMQISMYHAT